MGFAHNILMKISLKIANQSYNIKISSILLHKLINKYKYPILRKHINTIFFK